MAELEMAVFCESWAEAPSARFDVRGVQYSYGMPGFPVTFTATYLAITRFGRDDTGDHLFEIEFIAPDGSLLAERRSNQRSFKVEKGSFLSAAGRYVSFIKNRQTWPFKKVAMMTPGVYEARLFLDGSHIATTPVDLFQI